MLWWTLWKWSAKTQLSIDQCLFGKISIYCILPQAFACMLWLSTHGHVQISPMRLDLPLSEQHFCPLVALNGSVLNLPRQEVCSHLHGLVSDDDISFSQVSLQSEVLTKTTFSVNTWCSHHITCDAIIAEQWCFFSPVDDVYHDL